MTLGEVPGPQPEGLHLVEQQAYYTVEDGRITWMRVVCGGYRPIDPLA